MFIHLFKNLNDRINISAVLTELIKYGKSNNYCVKIDKSLLEVTKTHLVDGVPQPSNQNQQNIPGNNQLLPNQQNVPRNNQVQPNLQGGYNININQVPPNLQGGYNINQVPANLQGGYNINPIPLNQQNISGNNQHPIPLNQQNISGNNRLPLNQQNISTIQQLLPNNNPSSNPLSQNQTLNLNKDKIQQDFTSRSCKDSSMFLNRNVELLNYIKQGFIYLLVINFVIICFNLTSDLLNFHL
jgi:hypothetical protein